MTDEQMAGLKELAQLIFWGFVALIGISILGVFMQQAIQNG